MSIVVLVGHDCIVFWETESGMNSSAGVGGKKGLPCYPVWFEMTRSNHLKRLSEDFKVSQSFSFE